MKLVLFIITLYLIFQHRYCANILGVFPAPGYSQFILAEVLMTELANRGHQVTVISPYSPKNVVNNYKTILTSNVIGTGDEFNLFELENENLFTNILTTYKFGNLLTEATFKNEDVQKLLRSEETFDLVIVEQFFNEAMKGFSTHFNAPLVLFCSMGVVEWNKYTMGIPSLPSISPISYTSYTNHMNFFKRIRNLIGTIFDYYYRNLVYYPVQKKYFKKYFPEISNFDQVIYNASLMLLNSHVTTSENNLLPYNVIEIGGFHVIQKPLSKKLQEYLDESRDGVILFSMGTNLRSSDLSEKTKTAIFKVFRKLKQKIIWKFEENLSDKPENVMITKWLNQSDILAHPNVKLFITHGGLLSTTEAVFYGVPMVGIPIFADQKMNMARAKKHGIATVVPFQKLSEDTLFAAIDEIINNKKFYENAKKMSSLMKDRVAKPLDLAMFWIEYVIRHKGFNFKSSSMNLSWYQIYMIDIIIFILFILLLFYFLLRFTVSFIFKIILSSPNKNKKNQ